MAKGSGRFYARDILETLTRDELRIILSVACLLRASRKASDPVVAEAARRIILKYRRSREFYLTNVDREGYEIIEEINNRGIECINRNPAKTS